MTESDWKNLFLQQRGTELTLLARRLGKLSGPPLRALADDEIVLTGGALAAARASDKGCEPERPVCVVVTPENGELPEEFDQRLAEVRRQYPGAEVAGFGPKGWSARGESTLDRHVVKLGVAADSFQKDDAWERRLLDCPGTPLTVVLVYSPSVTPQALEQAVAQVADWQRVGTVACLPLGAGDRIPLPGVTTSGPLDMTVLSTVRMLIPGEVRVRASWAALGWKVAQLAPLYGADELMGWSAAECLAYTGRVRAAARVEKAELEAGLAEAGVARCNWVGEKVGTHS